MTKEDLLQGRDDKYPKDYNVSISMNLDRLAKVMTEVEEAYGKKLVVNSGWRPPAINAALSGSAPKSNHMKGLAVDVSDADGHFMNWCLKNLAILKQLGIYLEDLRWTPTWVHCQIVGPLSGHRIFIPNTERPTAPDRWSGTYDNAYDRG